MDGNEPETSKEKRPEQIMDESKAGAPQKNPARIVEHFPDWGYGTAKDVPTSTGKCKLLVDISCANSISGVVVSPSLFCYNGNHKITVLSADT